MSNEPKKPRTRKSSSCPAARQTSAAGRESLELQNARLQQELAERKQAETTLLASEERFRALFENSPLPIWLADTLGSVHQQRIIRKDINPSNIIVNSKTGQRQVIDFGLADKLSQRSVGLELPSVRAARILSVFKSLT